MKSQAIDEPAAVRQTRANDFGIIEKILRNRQQFFTEIRDGIDLRGKIKSMLITSIAFFALYGIVMGSSHSLWQTLSSGVKLPLLFLATLFVCVPSLYFFGLLFGSNQSFNQNLAVILTAVSVTSVLLLSCAPITLFFLVTTDTTSQYQFFKILNVAIFTVAGLMGIVFLIQGMKIVSGIELEGAKTRKWLFIIWMFVYAFVGGQMAWTIRPFIGAPGTPFELFRQLGGNFYTDIFRSLGEILGYLIVR
jgi:hypothetical protein